jgi:osmotically-inducible protein OsmY
MRRFFVGVALYTLAAVTPLAAWGGDREIAEEIFSKLKGQQAAGVLQGFSLDLGVTDGQVVLKGSVADEAQHQTVLEAARSVEGVTGVVDEVTIQGATAKPKPVKIEPVGGSGPASFELSKALQEQTPLKRGQQDEAADTSMVRPAGATAPTKVAGDAQLKQRVISTLGGAQRTGQLRGFGLEVTTRGGDVLLSGRTTQAATKSQIMEMVRRVPGVRNVIDDIRVEAAGETQPVRHLQPVAVQDVAGRVPTVNDARVAAAQPVHFQDATMVEGANVNGQAISGEVGYVGGAPVPMTPIPSAHGAPRYDNPHMPNYAWPGYAAYPNYAAVTYPQQYSPTAWPYIGPFYPYPQVPLGWRKVSLEWDDGWWFLDFTDR